MIFFFKRKAAYEIWYGLGGSEMCIRDRSPLKAAALALGALVLGEQALGFLRGGLVGGLLTVTGGEGAQFPPHPLTRRHDGVQFQPCLLYTSDAADDLLRVDLCGRRIIKTKKKNTHNHYAPPAAVISISSNLYSFICLSPTPFYTINMHLHSVYTPFSTLFSFHLHF